MSQSSLTPEQLDTLRRMLVAQRDARQLALDEHRGEQGRVEHAAQVLGNDRDAATEHDADREVDLAVTELEVVDLARTQAALERIEAGRYGLCAACGAEIPYDRLLAAPAALRCLPCETASEGRAGDAAYRRARAI